MPSWLPHSRWKKIGCVVYKNEVRCKYSTQIWGRKMLFLGHFVVNWSEQLAVMQLMELLFSFHLRGLCLCVSKQRKARQDEGKSHNRGKYNQMMVRMKENIKPEHTEGIRTGVSRFLKHLPAPFTFLATNSQNGISPNFKYFSK